MQAEIVVEGAGVVGASIAWHLARRGCEVVVIETAPTFGTGSTCKATGGFRAQFDTPVNVQLSLLSREKLLRFQEETGADPGYTAHGYLFLACNEAELAALENAQRVQHACGLAEARMVTAAEARTLNPNIGDPAILGGAFCPTDGFIRPMNILRGYLEAAQRLGVRVLYGRDAQGVSGTITINARGPWCGAPVSAVRRNVAATILTGVLPETMPMTIWAGDWYHLRVRDGRVLLLWPDDPVVDDATWLDELLRKTHSRMPCLNGVPIAERWSGFYEMSPDEHALLGRIDENHFVANGSSGHGVMHAPALGQLLAELIVDGRTTVDVSALHPLRFRRE